MGVRELLGNSLPTKTRLTDEEKRNRKAAGLQTRNSDDLDAQKTIIPKLNPLEGTFNNFTMAQIEP